MRALLIRCYPAAWRERYGDEFASILEERPLGPFDVADVLLGALDARLRMRDRRAGITQRKGFSMSLRIGGIAAILGATSLAIAWILGAGVVEVEDIRALKRSEVSNIVSEVQAHIDEVMLQTIGPLPRE